MFGWENTPRLRACAKINSGATSTWLFVGTTACASGPNRTAFQRVLETFFGGSLEEALSAHFLSRKSKVTSEERDRLVKLIEQARREGR
jgi:hypothetical protein